MKAVVSIVVVVAGAFACASPPPARVVAAPPTPIKYIEPELGLNNSGLDTSLATKLDKLVKGWGSPLRAPYMTLSFMALLVIPALKLSDRGLFDGAKFEFTDLVQ